jgi:hypothetical protein
MAVSIKCTDVIRPYSGDTDCAEWIRKVELVAKLQSIDELEKFIPLFLVGGAFSVYEALSDEKKTDYEKLKAALLKAFSVNQTTAYEQFINRRLLPGETVDVLVADLNRLATLVDEDVNPKWMKCAVIHAMPTYIKRQLVTACSIDQMELSEVVERARALVQSEQPSSCNVSISDRRSRPTWKANVECYRCGQRGHLARECTNGESRQHPFDNMNNGPRGSRAGVNCGTAESGGSNRRSGHCSEESTMMTKNA